MNAKELSQWQAPGNSIKPANICKYRNPSIKVYDNRHSEFFINIPK